MLLKIKRAMIILCLLGTAHCTNKTADIYLAEPPEFNAEIQNIEADLPLGVVLDQGPEVPVFPSYPVLLNPFTVEVKTALEIPKASLFDVRQTISLKSQENQPKLDLLFVIDDSRSMGPHQDKLKRNIDKFVDRLSQLALLDYQIGVTATFDSKRYYNKVSEFSRLPPYGRNFERMGKLFPLKGMDASVEEETRVVTTAMSSEILGQTLKVGAKEWQDTDIYKNPDSGEIFEGKMPSREDDFAVYQEFVQSMVLFSEATGPEYEELLNPMLMAVYPESLLMGPQSDTYRKFFPGNSKSSAPQLQERNSDANWIEYAQNYNKGFVRDNAHLGVIIVTDTVDQSHIATGLTGAIAASRLARLKGDSNYDRISTYGVLHKNSISKGLQAKRPSEWSRGDCAADFDIRNRSSYDQPQELEKFFALTKGNRELGSNILNLCSPNTTYGQKLALIAEELFVKSVATGVYKMEAIAVGQVNVFFKDQPETRLPVCREAEPTELCWSTRIRSGERNIVIKNQQNLAINADEVRDIVVEYKAIDPETASQMNSERLGR